MNEADDPLADATGQKPIASEVSIDTLENKTSKRIALCVEYDGSSYSGWQAQHSPTIKTVQEELEAALSQVANHPIKLICAGRTDAGVHASGQIVHFDTISERLDKAWVKGANSLLQGKISVIWAVQVREDFHARFSAQKRRYRYVIYNRSVRPALLKNFVTQCYFSIEAEKMHQAAQYLVGQHDFSSYRGVACQAHSPVRTIEALSVIRYGDYVIIDILANAFLLHMVRNIAGVLLEIGQNKQPPKWAKEVLDYKDRTKGGVTAAPDGLYLVKVEYPLEFGLPETKTGPDWLTNFPLK